MARKAIRSTETWTAVAEVRTWSNAPKSAPIESAPGTIGDAVVRMRTVKVAPQAPLKVDQDSVTYVDRTEVRWLHSVSPSGDSARSFSGQARRQARMMLSAAKLKGLSRSERKALAISAYAEDQRRWRRFANAEASSQGGEEWQALGFWYPMLVANALRETGEKTAQATVRLMAAIENALCVTDEMELHAIADAKRSERLRGLSNVARAKASIERQARLRALRTWRSRDGVTVYGETTPPVKVKRVSVAPVRAEDGVSFAKITAPWQAPLYVNRDNHAVRLFAKMTGKRTLTLSTGQVRIAV